MSAIDELKSPTLVLDSTGEDDTSSEGIYIDASTEDTSSNRVDLSNLGKPKGSIHQVINPKSDKKENNTTKVPTAPTSRREISIDAVAQPEPVDPNTHVSPIDDMINPDNPNSMFSKYVRQKDEEAREWIKALHMRLQDYEVSPGRQASDVYLIFFSSSSASV